MEPPNQGHEQLLCPLYGGFYLEAKSTTTIQLVPSHVGRFFFVHYRRHLYSVSSKLVYQLVVETTMEICI